MNMSLMARLVFMTFAYEFECVQLAKLHITQTKNDTEHLKWII